MTSPVVLVAGQSSGRPPVLWCRDLLIALLKTELSDHVYICHTKLFSPVPLFVYHSFSKEMNQEVTCTSICKRVQVKKKKKNSLLHFPSHFLYFQGYIRQEGWGKI